MRDVQNEINEMVQNNPVVLFMKGAAQFPHCGFSAQVVAILGEYDLDFLDVNVLDDPLIREGIKEFGQWPTIPQLYVKGELIGGCDIITAMHQGDELGSILKGSLA